MNKAIESEVIRAVNLIPADITPRKYAVSWQGDRKTLLGRWVKLDQYREFTSKIEAWEFYKKKVNEMEAQR